MVSAVPSNAQTASTSVTWTCTGSPCPWGASLSGHALVWPQSGQAQRLGYTTSAGVYLPASSATGLTISLTAGSAAVFAGLPDASSHRALATINAGGSYRVDGLASGEVVSVQSNAPFTFTVSAPASAPPSNGSTSVTATWNCTSSPCPWGATTSGEALVWPATVPSSTSRLGYIVSAPIYAAAAGVNGMTVDVTAGMAAAFAGFPDASSHRHLATISPGSPYVIAGVVAGEVVSVQGHAPFTYQLTPPSSGSGGTPGNTGGSGSTTSSSVVQWTCTGSPCPSGTLLVGYAFAWSQFPEASSTRLGYTTSAPVYLPASIANRLTIGVATGAVNVYAGFPSAMSHRLVTSLSVGNSVGSLGLVDGEVLSVQSNAAFTLELTLAPPSGDPPSGGINSVPAFWRCNIPGCTDGDWYGAVIPWPSWSAYESNARSGLSSRTVYSATGELLYPYMGSWANGCEVTSVSGSVLIIEWQRGTDLWRATTLTPGQTHTIQLIAPEDGALIETDSTPSFSVTLRNCNPQVVPK
jgi:hypothetical protein